MNKQDQPEAGVAAVCESMALAADSMYCKEPSYTSIIFLQKMKITLLFFPCGLMGTFVKIWNTV